MSKSQIFNQLVDHFGGQTKTAKELGVKQSTVYGWINELHGMSAVVAIRAENKTNKKFKATDLNDELKEESNSAA